jgi:outer membrane cobalamin receptor
LNLGFLASLVVPAAAAEEGPVDVIVVEGSRLDLYVPARTDIDREELIESQRSELPEVLELTPGLNVRQGGRGEPRLDMRGFDQRAVLFTLDGVPVYEPWNGIVNLNLFPIELLQGVEVTRGPSSALYGPNGMAGTVRLNTLAARAPLMAHGLGIWRDSDSWDLRASGGGQRDALSVMAGGRYLTSDGYRLSADFDDRAPTRRRFEDGGLRLGSDREELAGFAAAGYRLPAGRLHAAFLDSSSDFGIPPSTTAFVPRYRRSDQDLLHAQSGVESRLASRVGAKAALFYSRYTTEEKEYDSPDFEGAFYRAEVESDEVGLIGKLDLDVAERYALAIATQVRRDGAEVSDTASGDLGEPDVIIASTAFENLYFATDRLTVAIGLSVDVQSGDQSGTTAEVDPQGGAAYDLGRFGFVRSGVSRKVRFPTLRELFDPLQGNPDLDPEKTLTYEIGYRWASSRADFDLALFRSDVDDLIETSGGADPQVATNLEDATLQGVEVATGIAPAEWLAARFNYTYLDAEAKNPARPDDSAEIQHRPPHRFVGIVDLRLPWSALLRLEGLYTSSQVDRFGSDIELGDFGVFNVRLSKRVGAWVELFTGVDNLLDTDYEEMLGNPQPGSSAYAGVQATY